MSDNDSQNEMIEVTDRELDYRFLERQWALLDSVKKLRMQVPLVTIGLILAITSTFVGLVNAHNIEITKVIATLFVGVVSCVGIQFYRMVLRLYIMRNNDIAHLYKKIGITSDHYSEAHSSKMDNGKSLFHFMMFVVVMMAVACIATIVFVPVDAR